MKLAPLAVCLACAAPALADVAVPEPAAKPTWADSCAARIDDAAKKLGLAPGARVSVIPLLREDGSPNPVRYVEYAPSPRSLVTVGDDAEHHADMEWKRETKHGLETDFRRYHGRFAALERGRAFMAVADECLKMGEPR